MIITLKPTFTLFCNQIAVFISLKNKIFKIERWEPEAGIEIFLK